MYGPINIKKESQSSNN